MHKFENPLRTEISLKMPDTPLARITMLNSDESEQLVRLPPGLGTGAVCAARLHEGLGFLNTDLTSGDEQFACTLHSPRGPLKFTFILSPMATQVSIAGEKRGFCVTGGESVILSVPAGVDNVIPPHYKLHNLCILADISLIEFYLRDSRACIPADFIRTIERGSDPYFQKNIITPSMCVILDQILTCTYKDGLRRLYLEAKCTELIVLRLELLFGESRECKKIHLTHSDIQRIHAARDLVVHCSAEPPTLHEIALAVGINSNKLKCGFKQVFGTTVFVFLRNLRLEQARGLLQEGNFSVTEVALEVGYNSLSHFARLFKQTYGLSPHIFMKQDR